MTKVAVTGANGLVGVNLIRLLLAQGYQARALIHHDSSALNGLNVEIVKGDILDKNMLKQLLNDAEVVFHAAAKISIGNTPYEEVYKTNVEGTKKVFSVAKQQGVKTFIYFSSIQSIQQPEKGEVFSEHRPLALNSPFYYDKTKAIAQQWLKAQRRTGMKVVILNPTAIIGPYDFKPSLIGEFLLKIMNRQLPGIVEGGYDWIDVRDVAQAAINAVKKGKDGEHYILSGKWYSLKAITKTMESISGKKLMPFIFPYWLAKTGLPFLTLWAKVSGSQPLYTSESLEILRTSSKNITSEKARSNLGFHARPIKKTLEDTMNWFGRKS